MSPVRWIAVASVAVVAAAFAVWFIAVRGPATVDPAAALPGSPGTALLIPGHGGNSASLDSVSGSLVAAGWRTQMVDIGDGSGDLTAYSDQVVDLARQVASSGGPVVLVGYSEGGLIARAAIARGAAPYVARVVTIATPHEGTSLAGLGAWTNSPACDQACRQMAPDSDFLRALPVAGDARRWLAVYSGSDDVIQPPRSGALQGATNAYLQDYCVNDSADHGLVVRDPWVMSAVASFASSGVVPAACS